jgi:hypothetical protein
MKLTEISRLRSYRESVASELVVRRNLFGTTASRVFFTFTSVMRALLTSRREIWSRRKNSSGNSAIKMTVDIYTDTSAEVERDAAIAVERAIYGDLFAPQAGGRLQIDSRQEGAAPFRNSACAKSLVSSGFFSCFQSSSLVCARCMPRQIQVAPAPIGSWNLLSNTTRSAFSTH